MNLGSPKKDEGVSRKDGASPQMDDPSPPKDEASSEMDEGSPEKDEPSPKMDERSPQKRRSLVHMERGSLYMNLVFSQKDEASPKRDEGLPRWGNAGNARPERRALEPRLSPRSPTDPAGSLRDSRKLSPRLPRTNPLDDRCRHEYDDDSCSQCEERRRMRPK